MSLRAVAAIGFAVGLAACGAGRNTGADRDRNVIRADEIAKANVPNAYDLVARLRSDFLRSRGPISVSRGRSTTPPAITVFVDGIESGPPERALPPIPALEVIEIRLYRAAEAATKFGSRHNGGVIEVTTKRTAP